MITTSISSRCGTAALLFTLTTACGDDGSADSGAGSSTDASDTSPSTTDGDDSSTAPTTSPTATTDDDDSTSTAAESDTGDETSTTADDGSESSGAADESSSGDDGSTTEVASLEIVGEWIDNFGGGHVITEASWVQTYGPSSFGYTIDSYDNTTDVAIAQSDDDGSWSRFDWTYDGDAALWYCQTGFGLDSAEEAEAFPPADASDPSTGGCGGATWSRLDPT